MSNLGYFCEAINPFFLVPSRDWLIFFTPSPNPPTPPDRWQKTRAPLSNPAKRTKKSQKPKNAFLKFFERQKQKLVK